MAKKANQINDKINAKINENKIDPEKADLLSQGNFDKINEIIELQLKKYIKSIEDKMFNKLINWCARQLIIIILGSLAIIGGVFVCFLSQEKEIRKLEIDKQNIVLEYEKNLNAERLKNFKNQSINSKQGE